MIKGDRPPTVVDKRKKDVDEKVVAQLTEKYYYVFDLQTKLKGSKLKNAFPWEHDFLNSITRRISWGKDLTPKQLLALKKANDRLKKHFLDVALGLEPHLFKGQKDVKVFLPLLLQLPHLPNWVLNITASMSNQLKQKHFLSEKQTALLGSFVYRNRRSVRKLNVWNSDWPDVEEVLEKAEEYHERWKSLRDVKETSSGANSTQAENKDSQES